jgi:hypothetical protein
VPRIRDLLRQGRHDEVWQMCCGFIDLSIDEFMNMQKSLLLEQIDLLKKCRLGRKVMHGAMPDTLEEFRTQVSLTTYKDYCPELLEQQENVLPAKVARWAHTSGKSGEYPFKWVPISERAWEEMGLLVFAAGIFGSCRKRGEVTRTPSKFLYATAPAPYTTGIVAQYCKEELGFVYYPSLDDSQNMTFMERLDKGFWMALSEGIDGLYALTAVLVGIGERFKKGAGNIKITSLLRKPKALFRVLKGLIKSKLAGRSMLPKDLWNIKAMACGGTDSQIFRDKIKDMWGVQPLDIYASTESNIAAMQTWDFAGMTFTPNLDFFEFIPESEHLKWQQDNSYQPQTMLLNEVKAGEVYELVITNLHGGALVRYRTGDMIRITALRNEQLNIDIPQMAFERRADDLIDLGTVRLNETVIWKAIEATKIPYADWTARKEVIAGKPTMHLYIELKDNYIASETGLAAAIYDQIKQLNDGFIHYDLPSIERLVDYKPITVTMLSEGAFSRYATKRHAEGADLAQLKPPHINPSNDVLTLLGAKPKRVEATEEEQKVETQIAEEVHS